MDQIVSKLKADFSTNQQSFCAKQLVINKSFIDCAYQQNLFKVVCSSSTTNMQQYAAELLYHIQEKLIEQQIELSVATSLQSPLDMFYKQLLINNFEQLYFRRVGLFHRFMMELVSEDFAFLHYKSMVFEFLVKDSTQEIGIRIINGIFELQSREVLDQFLQQCYTQEFSGQVAFVLIKQFVSFCEYYHPDKTVINCSIHLLDYISVDVAIRNTQFYEVIGQVYILNKFFNYSQKNTATKFFEQDFIEQVFGNQIKKLQTSQVDLQIQILTSIRNMLAYAPATYCESLVQYCLLSKLFSVCDTLCKTRLPNINLLVLQIICLPCIKSPLVSKQLKDIKLNLCNVMNNINYVKGVFELFQLKPFEIIFFENRTMNAIVININLSVQFSQQRGSEDQKDLFYQVDDIWYELSPFTLAYFGFDYKQFNQDVKLDPIVQQHFAVIKNSSAILEDPALLSIFQLTHYVFVKDNATTQLLIFEVCFKLLLQLIESTSEYSIKLLETTTKICETNQLEAKVIIQRNVRNLLKQRKNFRFGLFDFLLNNNPLPSLKDEFLWLFPEALMRNTSFKDYKLPLILVNVADILNIFKNLQLNQLLSPELVLSSVCTHPATNYYKLDKKYEENSLEQAIRLLGQEIKKLDIGSLRARGTKQQEMNNKLKNYLGEVLQDFVFLRMSMFGSRGNEKQASNFQDNFVKTADGEILQGLKNLRVTDTNLQLGRFNVYSFVLAFKVVEQQLEIGGITSSDLGIVELCYIVQIMKKLVFYNIRVNGSRVEIAKLKNICLQLTPQDERRIFGNHYQIVDEVVSNPAKFLDTAMQKLQADVKAGPGYSILSRLDMKSSNSAGKQKFQSSLCSANQNLQEARNLLNSKSFVKQSNQFVTQEVTSQIQQSLENQEAKLEVSFNPYLTNQGVGSVQKIQETLVPEADQQQVQLQTSKIIEAIDLSEMLQTEQKQRKSVHFDASYGTSEGGDSARVEVESVKFESSIQTKSQDYKDPYANNPEVMNIMKKDVSTKVMLTE